MSKLFALIASAAFVLSACGPREHTDDYSTTINNENSNNTSTQVITTTTTNRSEDTDIITNQSATVSIQAKALCSDRRLSDWNRRDCLSYLYDLAEKATIPAMIRAMEGRD